MSSYLKNEIKSLRNRDELYNSFWYSKIKLNNKDELIELISEYENINETVNFYHKMNNKENTEMLSRLKNDIHKIDINKFKEPDFEVKDVKQLQELDETGTSAIKLIVENMINVILKYVQCNKINIPKKDEINSIISNFKSLYYINIEFLKLDLSNFKSTDQFISLLLSKLQNIDYDIWKNPRFYHLLNLLLSAQINFVYRILNYKCNIIILFTKDDKINIIKEFNKNFIVPYDIDQIGKFLEKLIFKNTNDYDLILEDLLLFPMQMHDRFMLLNLFFKCLNEKFYTIFEFNDENIFKN